MKKGINTKKQSEEYLFGISNIMEEYENTNGPIDEKTEILISRILYLYNDKLQSIMTGIQNIGLSLAQQGCNEVIISFTGYTPQNKKIKSKINMKMCVEKR